MSLNSLEACVAAPRESPSSSCLLAVCRLLGSRHRVTCDVYSGTHGCWPPFPGTELLLIRQDLTGLLLPHLSEFSSISLLGKSRKPSIPFRICLLHPSHISSLQMSVRDSCTVQNLLAATPAPHPTQCLLLLGFLEVGTSRPLSPCLSLAPIHLMPCHFFSLGTQHSLVHDALHRLRPLWSMTVSLTDT